MGERLKRKKKKKGKHFPHSIESIYRFEFLLYCDKVGCNKGSDYEK